MRYLDMLHSPALKKELKRELRELYTLSLPKLSKRAHRNKRLLKDALAASRRYEYAARRVLAREYGRAIARRMRQV
jgi:hypothetical protein